MLPETSSTLFMYVLYSNLKSQNRRSRKIPNVAPRLVSYGQPIINNPSLDRYSLFITYLLP